MIDLANCRYYYRTLPCLVPSCKAEPTCAAHFPRHRGMGGAKATWAYNETVPLCRLHHDALDARNGAIGETWKEHLRIQRIVECLAPPFWQRIRAQAEAEAEAMHRLAEADEAACER